MKRLAIIAAVLSAIAAPAAAELGAILEEGLMFCAELRDDAERLACFDFQAAEVRRARLLVEEWNRFNAAPCDSAMLFRRAAGGWTVTCPGCASAPAERYWPARLVDFAATLAVDGQLTFTEMQRKLGACP